MFKKVLIANRGEIAVRVARTLREMGISPVAVYSEADRDALHVRVADEAYEIGPAAAAESYLRIDKLMDVARRAGCDGLHPGYGFLSENPKLPAACEAAGITFIGPPASAMRAMGLKTAAREKMASAGVPVVPGGSADTLEQAKKTAAEIGYPVMLKATAGGGGKGMRLVSSEAELSSALDRAKSEAKKAFGDETVYLEKAIIRPRHVEIQVLGDKHGNVVHLFERDCSIQRRHQKVVEESPCPAIDDAIVQRMGETAVQGAKAVGYYSAGTFEFLLSQDKSFYFLEMNTRLQVEHPITELCTGFDLVREMIRIAAGEELGFEQADVTRRGAAIECRVYAEDPSTGFLPSPGVIQKLRTPAGPGVRDDSGAYEGCTISGNYAYNDYSANGDFTSDPGTGLETPPDSKLEDQVWRISLEMPLYSGGAISAQRRQSAQEYNAARENLINLTRNTVTSTRSLHMTVLSDISRVKARKQSIVSSQSALDATQAGYEVGTRNVVDVLNAQNTLFVAQRDYYNSRYDYIANMLRLKEQAGILSPDDVYRLDDVLVPPPPPTAPSR